MNRADVARSRNEETAVSRSAAFRETFLFVFDPQEVTMLRRLVDLMEPGLTYRASGSAGSSGSAGAGKAGMPREIPYTVEQMVAVAADLSFLESLLLEISTDRCPSGTGDRRLLRFAQRLAPRLGALAESVEREIDRLLADEKLDW